MISEGLNVHSFQVNLFQLYNMTSNVFDGDYEYPSKRTIIAVFQREHGPANKQSFLGLETWIWEEANPLTFCALHTTCTHPIPV